LHGQVLRDLLDDRTGAPSRRFSATGSRRAGSRTLIDVRERSEFDEGYIPGRVHLSKGFIETRIEDSVPKRDTPITLYCAGGVRSLLAARALQELGLPPDVQSMAGGYGAWKQAGFDFIVPRVLTAQQQQRYSRHLLIPRSGLRGRPSCSMRACCSSARAASAARPRSISRPRASARSDSSTSTPSIAATCSVRSSTPRIGSGCSRPHPPASRSRRSNSDVRVVEHNVVLSGENAREIFDQYDIIVNGCDKLPDAVPRQ